MEVSKRSRQDWVREGLRRLAVHGVDGVRVEPLAKDLGVTKGSFYWHFADREALLDAMLEDWSAWATEDVIVRADQAGSEPLERLERLMEIVLEFFDGDLEFELRAWARRDERAARIFEQVDRRRTSYVRDLFREEGFDAAESETRAFLLYSTLFGNYLIPKAHGRSSRKRVLRESIDLLLR
jgi:AcrR family transcriptional regulator